MFALLWLIGIPTFLYHLFIPLTFCLILIGYQIYSFFRPQRRVLVLRKISNTISNRMAGRQNRSKSLDSAILVATMMTLVVAGPIGIYCLESDAALMQPLASLAKGVIKTVTLGEPLKLDFGTTDFVYNFASFTWRTGFPVTMPSGFVEKTQQFYNRVRAQVDEANVKGVERKTLAALKLDLDDIVDAIVEQVRQSPNGMYTNYLETEVKGVPLEEACVRVGIQLKAYGVDLTNYRNIAGMVLGVPVMPTVASTVMNVAEVMPDFGALSKSLGNQVLQPHTLPENAYGTLTQLSGSAYNSLNNIGGSLSSGVRSPLSLFGSKQTTTNELQQAARLQVAPITSEVQPVN